MVKKHSTTALTKEQKEAQDKRYKKFSENTEYDYVIIGTGNAALTVGSLLAKAGNKICMLEMHDLPGGYAQNFVRNDYTFCAQIHYTWGCGEGGKMHEFVKKIGLEKEITWELYDDGYDRMVMPDGKKVFIPYGYDKLANNIDAAYPGQKENVLKFGKILTAIGNEIRNFPQRKIKWYEYITRAREFKNLVKYQNKTLQNLFDECNLSKEAQAVLIANAGDMMEPPEHLSIFAYVGLFGGYNLGAYYPTKHFKGYVDALTGFIESNKGCHIYYETEVVKAQIEGDKVTGLVTKDGKVFKGKNYICNMDPQLAAKKLIGLEHFPKKFIKPLTYDYSLAGMVIYLGLKDIDLKKYGFGKFNTWHMMQWDMNKIWKEQLAGDFKEPWIFMSTPTLHSDYPGTAPEGCEILEIATVTDWKSFDEAQKESYAAYAKKKNALANQIIEWVEKNYIPDLKKHIEVKVVGTPTTNVDFVNAPEGNAYGSRLIPKYMGSGRLKAWTPFPNFFWCNASSGYGGIYGTCHTGVQLYMDLTGDRYMDEIPTQNDREVIAKVRERLKKEGRKVL